MNLPLPVALGIWVALGLAVLAVIIIGYRRRASDGTDLGIELAPLPAASALAGDQDGPGAQGPWKATYVSTTRHGDWLARIGLYGLGHRAAATVTVMPAGVLIDRIGEVDIWLPADRLVATGTADGMAGKFVGHDGLDVLTWRARPGSSDLLDTGLRLADPERRSAFQEALGGVLAGARASSTTTEETL